MADFCLAIAGSKCNNAGAGSHHEEKDIPMQTYSQVGSQRLAESESGPFTSDLSVSEFALVHKAGFEPLGLVLGSSVYHVGIQVARWGKTMELTTLTQAVYDARELAMTRMSAEAEALGSDGVVGVKLSINGHAWSPDIMEFMAVGTAIRHRDRPGELRAPSGRPFTSDISGQALYKLLGTGHVPVAFVLGSCVLHVAHQGALQSLRQVGTNTELPQFTQAIYDARELAMTRMQKEAEQARATGIVGVKTVASNWMWGEHATEYLAAGTAIRAIEAFHDFSPSFTLGLDT